MPRQPKAGDICHRMGKGRQQSAGWAIGEAHLRQRLRHGLAQKHLRQALHRHGIRNVGDVVGGDFGRSVDFDLDPGRVLVTSYQHGPVEL